MNKFTLKRVLGYVLGFVLFYEPFTLFQKIVGTFLHEPGFTSIHVPCARIPMQRLLAGDIGTVGNISLFFTILLIITSLWLGPLFCGKLCPAGALPEFLSRLVPERFKISWGKILPIVPIRYGFTLGFLFSTYMGFDSPCPYCNYFAFDLFINFLHTGKLLTTATSLIVTFILWFLIFGVFTKGGRGYCNFLCPVGAMQSFLHFIGGFIPGTYGRSVNVQQCVGCNLCGKICPMEAISMKAHKCSISVHHCIECGQCEDVCPKQAISYVKRVKL